MPRRIILRLVTVRTFFCLLVADIEIPSPTLPPATSSGGRQTGTVSHPDSGQPSSGNIGPDLRGQQQHEVPQGRDPSAESLDTRKEAAEALAARYRASRERLHESHSSGVDFVGA
jgi:hypothetical protein